MVSPKFVQMLNGPGWLPSSPLPNPCRRALPLKPATLSRLAHPSSTGQAGVLAMLTKHGAVTLGGRRLRVGTSRFLSQGAFLTYKSALFAYFLFWGVYWPAQDEPNVARYLSFWTWYIATAYYAVSTLSAYLCWRAIARRRGPKLEAGRIWLPTRAPSSSTNSSDLTLPASDVPPPVPVPLKRLQLVLWNISCLAPLIAVTIFWGAVYNGGTLSNVDFQAHALAGVILLVDQMLVADEYKLWHLVFTQAYGVCYVVWTVVWYFSAPERNRLIYDDLDWQEGTLAACLYSLATIAVLTPLFALLHLYLYRLREKLHSRRHEKAIALRTPTPTFQLEDRMQIEL